MIGDIPVQVFVRRGTYTVSGGRTEYQTSYGKIIFVVDGEEHEIFEGSRFVLEEFTLVLRFLQGMREAAEEAAEAERLEEEEARQRLEEAEDSDDAS